MYDRRSDPAMWSRLTPALAQHIKEELNSYKMEEMELRSTSRRSCSRVKKCNILFYFYFCVCCGGGGSGSGARAMRAMCAEARDSDDACQLPEAAACSRA